MFDLNRQLQKPTDSNYTALFVAVDGEHAKF